MLCHSLNPISLKLSPTRLLPGGCALSRVFARKLCLTHNLPHSKPPLSTQQQQQQHIQVKPPKGNSHQIIDVSF